MDREARKILYGDLKAKGFTHEEANEQLRAWDSDVEDKVAEKKEEDDEGRAEPRHGTTCVGIVAKNNKGKHVAVAEW